MEGQLSIDNAVCMNVFRSRQCIIRVYSGIKSAFVLYISCGSPAFRNAAYRSIPPPRDMHSNGVDACVIWRTIEARGGRRGACIPSEYSEHGYQP